MPATTPVAPLDTAGGVRIGDPEGQHFAHLYADGGMCAFDPSGDTALPASIVDLLVSERLKQRGQRVICAFCGDVDSHGDTPCPARAVVCPNCGGVPLTSRGLCIPCRGTGRRTNPTVEAQL